MDNNEPLDHWAARREKRLRPVGERKMMHLTGPPRAPHVDRDAPRVVLEWDGFQWVTLAVVANYTEAARLLYPDAQEMALGGDPAPGRQPDASGRPGPLGEGTGRHRKTT
ncbi:DUF6087 family protein [Embleya sp. NPDC001921]